MSLKKAIHAAHKNGTKTAAHGAKGKKAHSAKTASTGTKTAAKKTAAKPAAKTGGATTKKSTTGTKTTAAKTAAKKTLAYQNDKESSFWSFANLNFDSPLKDLNRMEDEDDFEDD